MDRRHALRLAAGVGLLAAIAHAQALSGFFLRDDLVALDRVSSWSTAEVLARIPHVFTGPLGDRAHAIGYLHFALLWKLFGTGYIGYALVNLALHATIVMLCFLLGYELSRRKSVALLAAVLFGLGGGSWEVGWIAAVQHHYLALGVLGMALAYARFRSEPGVAPAVLTVASALLATLSLEAGSLATAVPLLLEGTTRAVRSPAPVASERARLALALGAFGVGLPRLLREASLAVLLGQQPIDENSAKRYAVSLAPDSVLAHYSDLVSTALLAPALVAALLIALLTLAGLSQPRLRRTTLFGFLLGLYLALPFAALRGWQAAHFALVPSLGFSLALGAGAVAVLDAIVRYYPRARLTALGVLTLGLLVHFGRGLVERAGRDRVAVAAQKAVARDLPKLLAKQPEPCDLALFDLPRGPRTPDFPLVLQHALPVFVGRAKFSEVYIVDATLAAELDVDFVHFVKALPAELAPTGCALRFDGDKLVPAH